MNSVQYVILEFAYMITNILIETKSFACIVVNVFVFFTHDFTVEYINVAYFRVFFRTLVVGVNFIHEWRNLQLNVESKRQSFLRNFSWQFHNLFSRVFTKNLLRGSLRKNNFFFLISLCLTWVLNRI